MSSNGEPPADSTILVGLQYHSKFSDWRTMFQFHCELEKHIHFCTNKGTTKKKLDSIHTHIRFQNKTRNRKWWLQNKLDAIKYCEPEHPTNQRPERPWSNFRLHMNLTRSDQGEHNYTTFVMSKMKILSFTTGIAGTSIVKHSNGRIKERIILPLLRIQLGMNWAWICLAISEIL